MSRPDPPHVVDRLLDDPLAEARQGDGVAFVGLDLPIEILLASGRPFGHLPWRRTEQSAWADQWLESSFPFWARSILEQWHDGAFDGLDLVVFSRADDASQRLYYYVRELRRRGKLAGPEPRIFDIALAPRASSLAHTVASVVDLMALLHVGPASLAGGIERANRLRRSVAAIEHARSSEGPWHERLWRAALWSDPTRWLDDVVSPPQAGDRPRVLLAGSMPADGRLHEAVEAGGASVVAEAHALAPSRFGPEIAAGETPGAPLIARRLRQLSVGPRAFFDRAAWLASRARTARADAVILWLMREDEALAWTLPAQRSGLTEAGVPTLVLPAARWQADDDTLDRITDFCGRCVRATT
jgi:hypothetical protein